MEGDSKYEPMDVDLSAHSTSVMDISYVDSNIDTSIVKTEPTEIDNNSHIACENYFDLKPEAINKLILSNIQSRKKAIAKSNLRHQPLLYLGFIVIIISILTHQILNFNCCESLNIDILRHKLMTRVYGQTTAVENIINALESKESKKVLLFYGGTGVGKTFTTRLLLENLFDFKNIYHYTMPTFLQTFSSEFMLGLLLCKSTILVVDDLSRKDVLNIKVPIKELMFKSETLSKNITIILIYNCDNVYGDFLRKCDESFSSELRKSLEDLDANKYFIKFDTLTEVHLRKCINDELADRNINTKSIDSIIQHFNATLDGCKGVYKKLQYMKIL